MDTAWLLKGPASEIRALHQELTARELPPELTIDGPNEEAPDLFDEGPFRASPWLELLIAYSAGVGSAATAKIVDLLTELVKKRRGVEVTPLARAEDDPDDPETAE